MRILRTFLTTIYFIFTMAYLAVLMWGVNVVTSLGGDQVNVPNLIQNDGDHPDTVYFNDIFDFWRVSVSKATHDHEIFIDSNNNGTEMLWFIPMKWANKTITTVKNVSVAVFAPNWEIKQIDKYRSAVLLIYDIEDVSFSTYKPAPDQSVGNQPYIVGIDFNGDLIPEVKKQIVGEKAFKNEILKIEKYASQEYDQFSNFINNTAVATWTYFEVVMLIVMSIFVIVQAPLPPINSAQTNPEGEYRFLPRVPLPRRVNRRKKVERKDEYSKR